MTLLHAAAAAADTAAAIVHNVSALDVGELSANSIYSIWNENESVSRQRCTDEDVPSSLSLLSTRII